MGPDLGQSYIVDSFMVVVLGGVGQLAGTVYAALGLGVLNKLLESWAGAVLAKIAMLVLIILFIQKRPQGLFALKGRGASTDAPSHRALRPPADGSRSRPRRWWSSCSSRSLNRLVPADSAFHVSAYGVTLAGKIMCYIIVAVAMDLVWGYAGILSLGHGLFFALGGYAMGMYLMRQIGRDGVYKSRPARLHGVPRLEGRCPGTGRTPTASSGCCFLVVAVPGVLAFVFGYFAFRSRIKGVYFSIITQALTYAAMLLFFRNETGFGGNNGFTDFKRILGMPVTTPETRIVLFCVTAPRCSRTLLLARAIVTSSFGRVLAAIRDAEARVMFCGYNTLWLQALRLDPLGRALRHRGRALRPAGRHHQSERDVAGQLASRSRSGWRSAGAARCSGPILGAGVVNGAKSFFTAAFPEFWLYLPGAHLRPRDALPAEGRDRPAARSEDAFVSDRAEPLPTRRKRVPGQLVRRRPWQAAPEAPSDGASYGRARGGRRTGPLARRGALPRGHQRVASTASGRSTSSRSPSTRASCAASSAPTAPARPR